MQERWKALREEERVNEGPYETVVVPMTLPPLSEAELAYRQALEDLRSSFREALLKHLEEYPATPPPMVFDMLNDLYCALQDELEPGAVAL